MSINLTPLTEDLNIIGALSDQPTQTATELKQLFDEAGNIIKDYINETLIVELQTTIEQEVTGKLSQIKPVGSLYLTLGNENPTTIFGGTWEKIQDKYLLGSGTKSAGETGGSSSKEIEIPVVKHRHTISASGVSVNATMSGPYSANPSTPANTSKVSFGGYTLGKGGQYVGLTGDLQGSVQTSETGNNGLVTLDITPPYIAINVWKRVS